MYKNKKVIIVLPAFNAAKTLSATIADIPSDIVDEIILCDDYSTDNTFALARTLNIKHIITHNTNRGYGANQKSLKSPARQNISMMLQVSILRDLQFMAWVY